MIPNSDPTPVTPAAPLRAADEQLLLALLSQVQQLNERVLRLESLAEQGVDDNISTPSQHDLLEVQLHSARVAAEVSRVAIELRAEIAQAVRSMHYPTPEEVSTIEGHTDAEIIDLTINHPSGRKRSAGWIPDPSTHNRRHTDR